jgi:capsular polysaccharide biosynthesis protein
MIRELERKAAEEELAQPVTPAGGPPPPRATGDAQADARIAEYQRQIALLVSQILSKQREEQQLKATIGQYQARVEAAPARESELVALTRDYDTLRERYTSLLSKREDAKIAANLERRQIGEQFKVIDAARLPERPESPNRPRLYLMGLLAGIAVGAGLAALLEYRDTSLRTDEDVLATLSLPVLALVPYVTSSAERQRVRKRRLLLSAGAVAAVLLLAVASVWKLGLFAGRF